VDVCETAGSEPLLALTSRLDDFDDTGLQWLDSWYVVCKDTHVSRLGCQVDLDDLGRRVDGLMRQDKRELDLCLVGSLSVAPSEESWLESCSSSDAASCVKHGWMYIELGTVSKFTGLPYLDWTGFQGRQERELTYKSESYESTMSNKAVPQTYRAIIDKVINSVRADFEENGVEDAVLQALQESWEAKLVMSRVADFSSDARLGAYQGMLPPLLPKENKQSDSNGKQTDEQDVKPNIASTSKEPQSAASTSTPTPTTSTSKSSKPTPSNDNELGSDLDESDDGLSDDGLDGDDDDPNGLGGSQEGDIIIALYEKVQRVKNKWKITLKDGVISAEGKDYVFSKCQGDFEW